MIDTIVLRIHNLSKYPQIYEQYYAPSNKKNSFTEALFDVNTGEIIETTFSSAMVFHDSNRIIKPRHRSHMRVPSSHYDLAYNVDTRKDYLEFNFSIPKYLYATNVLQFVNEIDCSCSATFSMLQGFLFKFLNQNFLQTPLFSDVEINRIDLCYNQFFDTKASALAYLEEQKKLLLKYARSSKNNYRSYDTSLMYVTRRYSFKIYHKGTEFKAHDLKQLEKSNPFQYPLEYFGNHADTILRYEMTFRSSYLSYLMQHYFFTSEAKSMYAEYSNHSVPLIWQDLIKKGYHKVYENYCRTGKFFTLQSIYDINQSNFVGRFFEHNTSKNNLTKDYYNILDTVTFDRSIFSMLFNTFWDKVKQYQLTQIVDVVGMTKKIDLVKSEIKARKTLITSNAKEERQIDKTRMIILGLLINCNFNINQLKKYMPLRTFERIVFDLKKLGIDSKHSNINIPLPRLDYLDYRIYFSKFIRYQ